MNLHIPVEVQHAFPGKIRLTESLKTADPQVARQKVILAQARFIELAQGARQLEVLNEAVAKLPPDQRALFDEAGSVSRLQEQFDRTDKARAFLMAGGALTESDQQIGTVKEAPERVSVPQHERAYLMPQPSTIAEREVAEAAHKAELVEF